MNLNLIANTGIQLYIVPLEIRTDDQFKMFFYEWMDLENQQLKLESAHFFNDGDVWVKKRDLANLGFLQPQDRKINGTTVFKGDVTESWNEISIDFEDEGYNKIPIDTDRTEESGCFFVGGTKFKSDLFENKWLPMPYFAINSNGQSTFGPTNWCRCKLIPRQKSPNVTHYDLLMAFDTRTMYEAEGFEDDDIKETPVFAGNEASKDFALCNDEFLLLDYLSGSGNSGWVDKHLQKVFHNTNDLNLGQIRRPRLNYLAQYVFLIRYIQRNNTLPVVTLYSDKNVANINVDLVVDIGNSRTMAILFDNSDFTRVESLSLQNFTSPVRNKTINLNNDSFEMRLAFREADLGGTFIVGSRQFLYPSLVRLGPEAEELIHKATNLNTGKEKTSTFSSPKRYLWDNVLREKEWEFVHLLGDQEDGKEKSIWLDGISKHLNPDGSLNHDGTGGISTRYSRRALMTFCFLELISQAYMQINSIPYRIKWGSEATPRKLGRIILTCPTAMSMQEQVALRKCAEDAYVLFERFNNTTNLEDAQPVNPPIVIPSSRHPGIHNGEGDWKYDEATCSQFVYLYAEIEERYLGNCKEFFEFYGSTKKGTENDQCKSITIGSVDIGGGTTDLMVAEYKYNNPDQCLLTPDPVFWESFYKAGDDLLKEMVRQLVIEGQNSAIQNQLVERKVENIPKLIISFFGEDNARMSVKARQIRSEFNLQVSLPVVTHFLELLNKDNVETATLKYKDIFVVNKPTDRVLEHFYKHFGIRIEELEWVYNKDIVSKIVVAIFESLVNKISSILSYFGCDIVLLTGRPTSLEPLSNLFYKYFPVSPNRIIALNNYRVGTWYPFQDGKGYFSNTKSIVAVGAMIGNVASSPGNLNGFSLDMLKLKQKLLPTTEYFSQTERGDAFLLPEENNSTITVNQIPSRFWTRQLNSSSYPSRPFYNLSFNLKEIERKIRNKLPNAIPGSQQFKDAVEIEITRLRNLGPYRINIIRPDYQNDKEGLEIDNILSKDGDSTFNSYFNLQIQSMEESEEYWMDSGIFRNLNI